MGISRATMTTQFQMAVETFALSYADLKELVRNSLEYAFVPGESFWQDRSTFTPVAICATALDLVAAPSADYRTATPSASARTAAPSAPHRTADPSVPNRIAAPSAECAAWLEQNERARLQWQLESSFAAFEARY